MLSGLLPVLGFLLYAGSIPVAKDLSVQAAPASTKSVIIGNPFPAHDAVYSSNTVCVQIYGDEKNNFSVKIFGRKKNNRPHTFHQPEIPFQLLGEYQQAQTAEKTCITWNQLEEGMQYEWFVTVQTAAGNETSRTWNFTYKQR